MARSPPVPLPLSVATLHKKGRKSPRCGIKHHIAHPHMETVSVSHYEQALCMVCVSHISRKLAAGLLLCSIQHAFCRGSSSVISPALSHLRRLICSSWGSSISVLYSNEATSRVAKRPSTQTTHWIMGLVATETKCSF